MKKALKAKKSSPISSPECSRFAKALPLGFFQRISLTPWFGPMPDSTLLGGSPHLVSGQLVPPFINTWTSAIWKGSHNPRSWGLIYPHMVIHHLPSLKLTVCTWKGTISIGNTSSNHQFSGAKLLVSGRVHPYTNWIWKGSHNSS